MAQCTAFLDTANNKIVAGYIVRRICSELGTFAADLDMIPLYRGGGEKADIAQECDKCGAPMGHMDPDECRWVRLSVCIDCREY